MQDARVTPLGAAPIGMEYGENGEWLAVLTKDGLLHRVDTHTARISQSLRVMPALGETGHGNPKPDLAVVDHEIWLSNPTTGELLLVNGDTMQLERRLKVGGQPTLLEVVELSGVQH